jgi:hypothetical protein
MAADLEGPVALVGVLVHAQLVVQQLAGQRIGLGRARQQDSPRLEQCLQSADQLR